jgi:D-alanyl-D-alanine-carboxypeptidase/D-alanyl-D-alanine-endopeptidase
MKKSLSALCLLLVACPTTKPQEQAPTQTQAAIATPAPSVPKTKAFTEQLNELLNPLIQDEWAFGLVVGTITKNKTEVFSFGKISKDNLQKPDENTVYEIGSITKVFTATLFSDMVIKKEVSLTDPIQKYLPEGVTAPKRGTDEITLLDLATHTSGFPVIPQNFWPTSKGSIYDPNVAGEGWNSFTEEKFYDYLKSPNPAVSDKKQYVYSNFGMGLLGHLLAKKTNQTYEELLVERILEPLQMKSTRITLTDEMRAHLATGHDADGTPTNPWNHSALDGAFAIKSSVHDLLIFMQANMGLIESPLLEAMRAAHQEQFKKTDLESMGIGWNLNKYGVVFHMGATGGYRSILMMIPSKQVGIVVLTNTLVGGSTDGRSALFDFIGGSVLNLLVGVPAIPITLPKVGSVKPEKLTEYAGQYGKAIDDPGGVKITLDGDKLWALFPGRVVNRVYPEADDTFFMKAYNVRFVFKRDEQGKVGGVEVVVGELKARLPKL